MSEDFNNTLTHVAQQSLRDKLRLLPHNPTDDIALLPLHQPNTHHPPLYNINNPPLILDLPHHEAPNPNDWLTTHAHRYQDLSNLYASNINVDIPTHLLQLTYPDQLVAGYTTPKLGNPNEMGQVTQGLTLSLAASTSPMGLVTDLVPLAMNKNLSGHCAAGPLGPFTGYATILQSSKFLKPAQQLLEECCTVVTGAVQRQSLEVCRSFDVRGSRSVASSSRCSFDVGGDGGGVHMAEIHERKAKLLVLQGEVCRRYKQYNQQIEMAISSFESVAGLSGAIPFMSAAVKTISRHFRFLRNSISEQVAQISRALGEEVASSPTFCGVRATTSKSKFLDQTLRRQKAEESGLMVVENNQPVWRPQRGLPERAVAVLRAWLFDHFLHPYPTDNDKMMLAQQTGLTRNQVSNWFINARVRVWKPMVEEIHTLETKGLAEKDQSTSKSDSSQPTLDNQHPQLQQGQHSSKFSHLSQEEPQFDATHCQNMEHWPVEKRSRMDPCSSGTDIGGELVDLSAYQGPGFNMGGLGPVSLTLALRQEEGSWQQSYQQMRGYFGSQ